MPGLRRARDGRPRLIDNFTAPGADESGGKAIPAPILVTGCSSGIGRATALAALRTGMPTYATARKVDSLDDLQSAGARVLALDVTDEESMLAAVRAVEAEHGHVGVLVNNAGYGEYGPVEELDLDDVRRQFETNVFGLVRMCQLVLPAMRAAGSGRLVNMSSMGGEMTLPGGGAYHASKYAVEAFSDALRFEVRDFGVRVVVIQPGPVVSGFGERALSSSSTSDQSGPYAAFKRGLDTTVRGVYARPGRLSATTPEHVAEVVLRAATTAHPHARYKVTATARALPLARHVLPATAWDALLRRTFPPG